MRTKRMKATRIGSRLLSLTIALLCFAGAIEAKKDKPEATEPFALIAGTVFRPPGLALAGAAVVISPESTESGNGKLKKIEAVTDARGEWAVRVAPVPADWRVHVKMNGYRPEQRSVSVKGEQRIDLSIILEPAAQSKEATQ